MASFADLPLFRSAQALPPSDLAEQGKEDGMAAVWDNASPAFREAALQVLRNAAKARPEISANDLWSGLDSLGVTTHENRAAGPAMTAAARRGWIVSTERTIKADRPSRHKGDVRVWRSLLYQP